MTTEKLDCEGALDLLQDYLKAELDEALTLRLHDHLERCRPCFAHAEFERRFIGMIAAKAGRQCCPDAVRARILAALGE